MKNHLANIKLWLVLDDKELLKRKKILLEKS